eukprot:7155456-Pyramimonas_sp.AAC.1
MKVLVHALLKDHRGVEVDALGAANPAVCPDRAVVANSPKAMGWARWPHCWRSFSVNAALMGVEVYLLKASHALVHGLPLTTL